MQIVGTKNGVATLMHLPKGHVWKLEPLLTYKNAPRHRRVHSYIVSVGVSDFPCFSIELIPN